MPIMPGQQISNSDYNAIAQPYYARQSAYANAGIPFGSLAPYSAPNFQQTSQDFLHSMNNQNPLSDQSRSGYANPAFRAYGGGYANPSGLSNEQTQQMAQYGTLSNAANPVVNNAIGSIYGNTGKSTITDAFPQARAVKNQSITDFTTQLLAAKPQQQAANNSQQNFIGSVYSDGGAGSLSGQLDQFAQQKAAATNIAARQAMGAAGRTYNLNRMNSGNNSYLDRAYGDTLAGIAAQQAGGLADQRAQNLQYLTGQRTGLLGRSQALTNQQTLDTLLPYQTLNQLQQSDASTAGLDSYSNPRYDYQGNLLGSAPGGLGSLGSAPGGLAQIYANPARKIATGLGSTGGLYGLSQQIGRTL